MSDNGKVYKNISLRKATINSDNKPPPGLSISSTSQNEIESNSANS